jgi:CRISPR/Cas system-associated exonuclease Cas4 (RecB family)
MKLISKSRFLQYLECPKDAWFRLHTPDLPEFEVSTSEQGRMDQGNDVESYAKQLGVFKGFVEVKSRGFKEFQAEVDSYLNLKVPAIYQPSFVADGFIVRCDFLVWNKQTIKWDLYEVKGTNSKKDDGGPRDHISDLAFQTIVLERYGVQVGEKYIVHLNDEYIRGEEIEVEKLFIINESTEQVEEKIPETKEAMEKCKEYLNREKEPANGCECHLYGRSNHCATFARSHPEIPEYSVHDLSRIGQSPARLIELVNEGIYKIEDIVDASEFSENQQNQIHTHKTGEVVIDAEGIKRILDGYSYPLYFFDYETFAPAVPVFPGYGTYQRIPIQFSLHVIDIEGGELRHLDYVHTENSDPSVSVAKLLAEMIDPKGTVLAWNFGFEKSVTKELALRLPEYEKVLNRICDQMQDLRDVFSKQLYVHKDFHGSSGVEAIMQVLLPEMNYDHLPYTGSDVGYVWWNDIVNDGEDSTDRIEMIRLIREYCKQDTLVMVKIWEVLKNL